MKNKLSQNGNDFLFDSSPPNPYPTPINITDVIPSETIRVNKEGLVIYPKDFKPDEANANGQPAPVGIDKLPVAINKDNNTMIIVLLVIAGLYFLTNN